MNSEQTSSILLDLDVKSKVNVINKWFIENNIINEHVVNNLVLFVSCYDDSIEDVEIFLDREQRSVGFKIYLTRWGYIFKSRRLYNNLKDCLQDYLVNYNIDIQFQIWKHKIQQIDKNQKQVKEEEPPSSPKTS